MEEKIEYLRRTTPHFKGRRRYLTRFTANVVGGVNDGLSLDKYYVELINDTLRQIRKGHEAYIFSLDHVKDVLRFEPNAQFEVLSDAGSIKVTLPRLARTRRCVA